MRVTRLLMLLAGVGIAGIVACVEDPATAPAEESAAATLTAGITAKWGPFLLEAPVDAEPSREACAQVVTNEGMFAGWFYANLAPGAEAEAIALWDRRGKVASTWGTGVLTWVVDANDRGMILTRARTPELYNDPHAVIATDDQGNSFSLPGAFLVFLTDDPVRINRRNQVMATYRSHFDEHDVPPLFPPETYVYATHLGALKGPSDPTRQNYEPVADCIGEAIDDDGAVYGSCIVEGIRGHYRWITADNPVPFPSGPDKLRDVRIHEVNRYGEVLGEAPAGAVYWSASTGRIEIPRRAGISRLEPVAINDRGVVLVSEFYSEGENLYSGPVAFWTRAGGTVFIPTLWPFVVVHDLNNHGVIAGCVGGDGPNRLTPAYWKID